MALDKLTLLDETIINNTATSVATTVVNNSAQTNYISLPVATASPTSNGWRVYKDSDTIAPTVGTGGSPNTTLTQNTDNPLNSTGDFRLTKTSSASRRGEGISTDFTIASRHLAKVLQISFDYELISGTLATDDIRVYIIANPSVTINQGVTNIVIEPVNVSIQGSLVSSPTIKLRHLATFQTHISVTSYRLCVHVASTSTSAYTVDFNNFKVWEPNQSIGAIITDWQSYTPTFTGWGTQSNISAYWRRVGGNLELDIKYSYTTTTAVEARISLPSGLVSSSNISTIQITGTTMAFNVTATNEWFPLIESGVSYITFGRQSGASAGLTKVNGSVFTNATTSFKCFIPIQGWGSNVAMSSDSGDGRVVSASYRNITSSSISPIIFTIREHDTHNSYNTTTGIYTVPISGIYNISVAGIGNSSVASASVSVFKNNVYAEIQIAQQPNELNYRVSGQHTLNCVAGDTIELRYSGGATTIRLDSTFSIFRISAGSQIMAQNETVACHYTSTNGQNINGTGDIIFYENLKYDTHMAYNSSTGIFIAPSSGKYLVIASGSTASGSFVIGIKKNDSSSVWQNLIAFSAWATLTPSRVTALVHLNAGEFISVGAYNVSTANLRTTEEYNNLFVMRVGI